MFLQRSSYQRFSSCQTLSSKRQNALVLSFGSLNHSFSLFMHKTTIFVNRPNEYFKSQLNNQI